MKRLYLAAALALGAATMPAGAQKAAPASSITVMLPGPPADAFRRTMSAFIAEGYPAAQASSEGGLIVSVPFDPKAGTAGTPESVFRATIIAAGDSTRVVLTGTHAMRGVDLPPHPVEEKGDRVNRNLWARMQRLADAIRSGSTP